MKKEYETLNFCGQEVKVQGHMRPKIAFEVIQRPFWWSSFSGLYFCSFIVANIVINKGNKNDTSPAIAGPGKSK